MKKVTIHQAKTHLSRLIVSALEGEEIVIARRNTPLVRLVPIQRPRPEQILGDYRGRVRISDDFDQPLEDFEGYR